jgi:anaphase-promoting complex subunit 2
MMDLSSAWSYLTDVLSSSHTTNEMPDDVADAVEVLYERGIDGSVVHDWFFESVRRHFSLEVATQFWTHFEQSVPDSAVFDVLEKSFGNLHAELTKYLTLTSRLIKIENIFHTMNGDSLNLDDSGCQQTCDQLRLIMKATVFTRTSRFFVEAVQHFLHRAFRAFDAKHSVIHDESGTTTDDGCDALLTCNACGSELENCKCEQMLASFRLLVTRLGELGVLERIAGEPAMMLVHERIEQHIESKCCGNFDSRYLALLEEWLNTKVVSWLEELFHSALQSSHPETISRATLFPAHRDRLHHFLCEMYGRTRIQQLFNIIIEFPESEPALQDLAECLEHVSELRAELVQSLRSALESRLLHPGVNTADVLTAYVSAIRALRVLDTSGVLLDAVCDPVRCYLRGRDDTVRCIVSSLTEDGGTSELADELIRAQPLLLDDSHDSDDDVGNSGDWENWQPDPTDANLTSGNRTRRGADIISMLVNIYGSRELFVDEYRQLLADRLLTQLTFETDRDVRHVELLKLRFGDAHLHACEVMLKDVTDSRRINARITEDKKSVASSNDKNLTDIPVNALILSAQFWPQRLPRDEESPLVLPECLRNARDSYTRAFELLKGNRTLNWKAHLGLVSIDLELPNGRTLSYNVSPAHATVIWHFEQCPRWTINELAQVVQMPAHALRRRVAFWQSQGLLREETTDTFVLVEDEPRGPASGNSGSTEPMAVDDEDDASESAAAMARERRDEEFNVIWSYVIGMLTNLESLPLDRIHTMIRMFAMHGPGSQISLSELRAFLERKVKDQKLVCVSGVYRLPK